jgi:hypothetical protein
MTRPGSTLRACNSDDVAAYLDGELDTSERALFEVHARECDSCAGELLEQRRLLCTLDFALGAGPALALPKDFARIVAAHAESDMRGMRQPSERGRALRLCLVLAAASFALLGGAALSDSVLRPASLVLKGVASVVDCAWHALYNAGVILAVISRTIGGHLVFESRLFGPLVFLTLFAAAVLLPRLIQNYHRVPITREEARGRVSSP